MGVTGLMKLGLAKASRANELLSARSNFNLISSAFLTLGLLSVAAPLVAHAEEDGIPKIDIESELPKASWSKGKRMTIQAKSQIEMDAAPQENGVNDYSTKYSAGLVYRVTKQFKVAVFQPVKAIHKMRPGPLRDGKYHAQDLILGTAYKPNIRPGYFDEIVFIQNLHLPTGEESRYYTHTQGTLTNAIVVNHDISHSLSLRLNEEGTLHNQTTGWTTFGKKKIQNYQSDLSEYGELDWSPYGKLTFSQYFGYVHTWYMGAPGSSLQVSHEAYLETSVSYSIHQLATIIASYRNSADTQNVEHNWSPYRPDESTLVSAVKLVF